MYNSTCRFFKKMIHVLTRCEDFQTRFLLVCEDSWSSLQDSLWLNLIRACSKFLAILPIIILAPIARLADPPNPATWSVDVPVTQNEGSVRGESSRKEKKRGEFSDITQDGTQYIKGVNSRAFWVTHCSHRLRHIVCHPWERLLRCPELSCDHDWHKSDADKRHRPHSPRHQTYERGKLLASHRW